MGKIAVIYLSRTVRESNFHLARCERSACMFGVYNSEKNYLKELDGSRNKKEYILLL